MNLNSDAVKAMSGRLGAELCGIASVERFSRAPQGFHPNDIYTACKSVIVMASRFAWGTLQAMP